MIFSKIYPSFSSGEISPDLLYRIDVAKYNTGLKTCKNFIIPLEGGIKRRTGTRFIAKTKYYNDYTKKEKLIEFASSVDDVYCLEFGHEYIRFYKNKSQIALNSANAWITTTAYLKGDFISYSSEIYYCLEDHISGTFATDLASHKWIKQSIYEVPTVYDNQDIDKLKFIQSVDVLYITHPNYPTYELSRFSDSNWVFSLYEYKVPPFMLSNEDETHTITLSSPTGNNITMTSTKDMFEAGNVGSYYKIYHSLGTQSNTQTLSGNGSTPSIKCNGTWRIKTIGTTVEMIVNVEKSIDNGTTWEGVRVYTITNKEIDDYGTIDEYCLIRITVTGYVSGSVKSTLSTDPFTKFGIAKVKSITSSKIAVADVIVPFANIIASYDFAESCWSERRGYPSCCCFYQDRLVFANTNTQKQTIWFSKTGNYYSFDVSGKIKDDDSISINLDNRKLNEINNLILLRDLIVFTTSNEWKVGTTTGIITPTTIYQSVQGDRGCSSLSPVLIGNRIIYLQPSSKIVRDIGYDYNSDSFTGNNISLLSAHLFRDSEIVDMDYMQEPNSLVYMVNSLGKIICMNYMLEQEILGFGNIDSQGEYKNIVVLNTNAGNEIWNIIKRDNGKFIEVFEDYYDDVEDQWYLDSALKYEGAETDTISGLDHLNGMIVEVLGDGNVIRNLNDITSTKLIVENGILILPYKVKKAIIGLSFISEMETLPINIELNDGTSKTKKYRISEIAIIFKYSRGGFVGNKDINEYNEVINQREYLDNPIDFLDNLRININVNSSWGYDKTVYFKQEDPLPSNIIAIIPKIIIGG